MSVLSILKAFNFRTAQAAPHIITAVQAAEAAGPNATGAEKAAAVTGAVLQTLAGSSNVTAQEIATASSLVVAVFNLMGAFKKKAAQ